jgi:hypothetical protein
MNPIHTLLRYFFNPSAWGLLKPAYEIRDRKKKTQNSRGEEKMKK